MSKSLLLATILGLAIAVPAWSQKTGSTPSTEVQQSGQPCIISDSTNVGVQRTTAAMKPAAAGKTKPPVAVTDTTGVRKPFMLVGNDPDLPTTAKPGGDDTLDDQISKQNANNPAGGTHTSGGNGSGSSQGSGSGSSGTKSGVSNCR